MPIYEYACGKCGHEFEVEQRITEDPVKTCPKCRARKVKRLISQTSFVLKGGGWYSDLYSSKSKAKESAADSKPSDTSDTSTSPAEKPAKTDSKTDSKAEASPASKGRKKGGQAAA